MHVGMKLDKSYSTYLQRVMNQWKAEEYNKTCNTRARDILIVYINCTRVSYCDSIICFLFFLKGRASRFMLISCKFGQQRI
jgi:hypothetical protein